MFHPQLCQDITPLYALTRKGVQYQWTAECKVAFETSKSKLLVPPIPDFSKGFVLETDASKRDLGHIVTMPRRQLTDVPITDILAVVITDMVTKTP